MSDFKSVSGGNELLIRTKQLIEQIRNEAEGETDPSTQEVLSQLTAISKAIGEVILGVQPVNKSGVEPRDTSNNIYATGAVVGDGSIIADGDIVGRDKVTNNFYLTDIAIEEQEKVEFSLYLRKLIKTCNILDLRAIDREAVDIDYEPINLSTLYINLNVSERIAYGEDQLGHQHRILLRDISTTNVEIIGDWEIVPMTVNEFLSMHKYALILGENGSGKSTLANYLTVCFAEAALDTTSRWQNRLRELGWAQESLIPIKVTLGEFATTPTFGETARHLWGYIQEQLGILSEASRPLLHSLRSGKAFVMLDGLDEVDKSHRQKVALAVVDFVNSYPDNHYVITARPDSITTDVTKNMTNFNITKLAPLGQSQIDAFIYAWYSAARTRNWDIRVGAERDLVAATRRPDLASLAKSPLLLTQMIVLHSSSGRLPEDRVDLFNEVTKLLLKKWESRKYLDQPLALALGMPGLKLSDLETAVAEVAFTTYITKGLKPISKAEVIEILQTYFDGDWGKAQKFCDYIETRAGLLVKAADGSFAFPHPTFHEFLAARYLSLQNDFGAQAADLVKSNPLAWRTIYSMAVKLSGADRGVMAVTALCYEDPPEDMHQMDNLTHHEWYRAIVAAEALLEMGLLEVQRRPERKATFNRVLKWIVALVTTGALSVRERISAAKLLAGLGDTRKGVCTLEPDLVCIPKGEVFLTSYKTNSNEEIRSYEFNITYDFFISRYCVTQSQYANFIQACPQLPVPEGTDGYNWNTLTRTPPLDRLNHPVVLISWDDARSYCRWLEGKLCEKGLLPENHEVRLPSNAEWEKATRGGLTLPDGTKNPFPDRLYPWGDALKEDHANLPNVEPILAETTPVGIFPKGVSPYGIMDLSGNVMEWTTTSWGSYDVDNPGFANTYNSLDGREDESAPGFRILRGGSWLFAEGEAQCSCRLDPNSRFADVGFRIVVAPKESLKASHERQ